eukprot:TRINITY_DN10142_c0_g2_i1.p1 TRINITY_DN10142_c0_g2~~TRINITY_DN10142_c0_g2_i1.p1  ORF type:complete len:241 (-),score=25.03 TRINITY_DN10142_c0_g2_i1:173-895(-)
MCSLADARNACAGVVVASRLLHTEQCLASKVDFQRQAWASTLQRGFRIKEARHQVWILSSILCGARTLRRGTATKAKPKSEDEEQQRPNQNIVPAKGEGRAVDKLVSGASVLIDPSLWGGCAPIAMSQPPPKWKSGIIVLCALYPTVSFSNLFIVPWIQVLPVFPVLKGLLISCVNVVIMSWFSMPRVMSIGSRRFLSNQSRLRTGFHMCIVICWLSAVAFGNKFAQHLLAIAVASANSG